jgi:energy-converting hydrogenase Eha subunit C
MDGRANPVMDRKVVGVVFFGVVAMVAVVTSPQLLDVAWCSAVVDALVVVVIVVVIVVGVVVVVFVA